MTFYADLCREFAPDYDPRHIEAFLRLHSGGALDHLTREDFKAECELAAACVDEIGPAEADELADTYKL